MNRKSHVHHSTPAYIVHHHDFPHHPSPHIVSHNHFRTSLSYMTHYRQRRHCDCTHHHHRTLLLIIICIIGITTTIVHRRHHHSSQCTARRQHHSHRHRTSYATFVRHQNCPASSSIGHHPPKRHDQNLTERHPMV